MKICKLCYREFPEKEMTRGELCSVCKEILGKGSGYKNTISDEKAEEWLRGIKERKQELIKRGIKI